MKSLKETIASVKATEEEDEPTTKLGKTVKAVKADLAPDKDANPLDKDSAKPIEK